MVVDQAPHESGFAVIFKGEQMSFAGQTECRRDPWTSLSTYDGDKGGLPAAVPTRRVQIQEHRS